MMGSRRLEYRTLRRRQEDLAAQLDRARPRLSTGTRSMLVQVFNGGAMPASGGKFFDTHPVVVTGTEVEGGAGSFAVDSTSTIPVYFTGSRVPVAGDTYVARFLDYRWVVEARTATPPPCLQPPGFVCLCACPLAFHKTATIEDSNGTWTLDYQTATTWQVNIVLGTESICPSADAIVPCFGLHGTDPEPTGTYEYGYRLKLACDGHGVPTTWTLEIWNLAWICCTDNHGASPCPSDATFQCCLTTLYPFTVFAAEGASSILKKDSNQISASCPPIGSLTFTLPATITGCGLPMPGGGGTLTVVFPP